MLLMVTLQWIAYNTILCSNGSLVKPASSHFELFEENKTLIKSVKYTPSLFYNDLLTDHYDLGTEYYDLVTDNYVLGRDHYDTGTDNYVPVREERGDKTVANNSSVQINMFLGSVTESLEPSYAFTNFNPLSFPVSLEQCAQESYVDIKGFEGSVYITEIENNASVSAINLTCQWSISVPEGNIIEIKFTDYEYFPCLEASVDLYYFIEEITTIEHITCLYITYPAHFTRSNTILLKFQTLTMPPRRVLFFKFYFKATPPWAMAKLPVTLTSVLSGYVTTPAYDGQTAYKIDAFSDLIIPSGHLIMISFTHLQIDGMELFNEEFLQGSILTLYVLMNGEITELWSLWNVHDIPTKMYNSSLRLHFNSALNANIGFKMLFSIHPTTIVPRTLGSGQYDCSVADQYSNFKLHLECNLQRECENGEDEVNCEFSHPGCNGSVGFQDSCYVLITWYKKLSWDHSNKECLNKGGKLVILNSPGKLLAFKKIFEFGKRREKVYVGLEFTEDKTLLLMYRYFWRWRDKTMAYNYNISIYWMLSKYVYNSLSRACVSFHPGFPSILIAMTCNDAVTSSFVCEFKTRNRTPPKEIKRLADVMYPKSGVKPFFSVNISKCIKEHVTFDFLRCDPASHCGIGHFTRYCEMFQGVRIPNYVCDNGDTLPFTLVCDFREDCRDGSDEHFCRHSLVCNGTKCRNSQCIKSHNACDGKQHCIDGSDEFDCNAKNRFKKSDHIHRRSMPSSIIDFDGMGDFTQKSIIMSDPCPETHFRCFDGYCMPVYVRCNGVYDCTDHEDEYECQRYTCPGFYRCRASSVCVHADHMCDGWAQCPQMDDEWACGHNLSCPDVCHCLGLAFVCTSTFFAHAHTDLRYLDAHGSGMSPFDVIGMPYLIHLNLSACGLETFPNMTFPNLRVLDLSDNGIRLLYMDIFIELINLRSLHLARNPLSFLINNVADRFQYNLFYVDLSGTCFPEFNSQVFSGFPHLKTLILSNISLTTITSDGFNNYSNLEQLDLTGNPIESFHNDLFRGLLKLRYISADNYRLCCKVLLPEHFNTKSCLAPPDLISSCNDLLSSDVHRWYLWALASLSVIGNVGCFVIRVLVEKSLHRSSLDLFLTNLNVGNAFSGIYLFIILLADISLRDAYLFHEESWKTSIKCKLAMFLFTMSTEVSVFILCLVTLERIIALTSPVPFLLQRRLGALTCVIVWLLSVVMAVIPLVEVTSYQALSRLSGICIPLFFSNSAHTSNRHVSYFNNLMFVNFLLICVTSVGEAWICLSMRGRVLVIDMTTTSREKIVTQRLISMAIVNTVSWYTVGMVGVAYFSGTPIPGEVNIGISIFVLPLSAALNPLLYTYSIMKERRGKREEERILKLIRSRFVTKKYEAVTCLTTVPECVKPVTMVMRALDV